MEVTSTCSGTFSFACLNLTLVQRVKYEDMEKRDVARFQDQLSRYDPLQQSASTALDAAVACAASEAESAPIMPTFVSPGSPLRHDRAQYSVTLAPERLHQAAEDALADTVRLACGEHDGSWVPPAGWCGHRVLCALPGTRMHARRLRDRWELRMQVALQPAVRAESVLALLLDLPQRGVADPAAKRAAVLHEVAGFDGCADVVLLAVDQCSTWQLPHIRTVRAYRTDAGRCAYVLAEALLEEPTWFAAQRLCDGRVRTDSGKQFKRLVRGGRREAML